MRFKDYDFDFSELNILNTFIQSLERVDAQWRLDAPRMRFYGFPAWNNNAQAPTAPVCGQFYPDLPALEQKSNASENSDGSEPVGLKILDSIPEFDEFEEFDPSKDSAAYSGDPLPSLETLDAMLADLDKNAARAETTEVVECKSDSASSDSSDDEETREAWFQYRKRSPQDKRHDAIEYVEASCPEMKRFFTQDMLNFIHRFLEDSLGVTLVDACNDIPGYPGVYMVYVNYFRRHRHFRVFDTNLYLQVSIKIMRKPDPFVSEVSVVQVEYGQRHGDRHATRAT